MKTIRITTWIAAVVITAGSAFAQGTGDCGKKFGGPPKTEEERLARQEQCQKANGGTCDGQGQCEGKGKGQGQGKGQQKGPRDGSGPRGGAGTCTGGQGK